jgi:Protein ENHANCED DISEASE RESISTANCE 2, C-terminal
MDYQNEEDEFEDATEYDWMEKIKSTGAIPYLELDSSCKNGWSTPTSDRFMVRGPTYLSDKVKMPAGEFLLKPLGFDWMKGPTKISEVLSHPNHRIRKTLNELAMTDTDASTRPFIWAFNLQLPNKDNYSAIIYFASFEPVDDGSLMDRFLKGDDSFKNSRLKLIANMAKAPWIVRTAVGEQAICILGRALKCKYTTGPDFIEVDVDIGSSIVANAIVHLAFGYVTCLTVDMAFLLEGQSEEELPERVLCAIRFVELDPASAEVYQMPSEEECVEAQNLLGTRLWKSFGISQLLHQNNSDELGSGSGSGQSSSPGQGLGLQIAVNGFPDKGDTDESDESNKSARW